MANAPPAGLNLVADQDPRIVRSMVALIVLPTIFVILRLISRRIAQAGYWWDDLYVVTACALCYIPCICVLIEERHYGFGKHIYVLGPAEKADKAEFLKVFYIYSLGYYSSISVIKLAVLNFYRRIFPVHELKLLFYIAGGVVLSYFLGSILTSIFVCTPIHYFWTEDSPGHCLNQYKGLIVCGAINVVIDFLIIALPVPLLWRLRTTVSQKGILTGIFVCAGFVCIISIIRLVVTSRLTGIDLTWNYANEAIWSAAEPCMGVISACIPSLRPLFSLIFRGTTKALGVSKARNSRNQDTTSSGSSRMVWKTKTIGDERNEPFTRLPEDVVAENRRQWGHDVSVRGGKAAGRGGEDEISLEEMNVPEGVIKVKDEVVVTSSDWLEYKDRLY